MQARKLRLVESPAERRAKLNADEPGEMIFTSQFEYVEAMQARTRAATHGQGAVKQKDLAKQGEMSGSTVGNMVSGKTHYPRFSTMFGIANALGLVVKIVPGPKK